jgi:hypothetical protein
VSIPRGRRCAWGSSPTRPTRRPSLGAPWSSSRKPTLGADAIFLGEHHNTPDRHLPPWCLERYLEGLAREATIPRAVAWRIADIIVSNDPERIRALVGEHIRLTVTDVAPALARD